MRRYASDGWEANRTFHWFDPRSCAWEGVAIGDFCQPLISYSWPSQNQNPNIIICYYYFSVYDWQYYTTEQLFYRTLTVYYRSLCIIYILTPIVCVAAFSGTANHHQSTLYGHPNATLRNSSAVQVDCIQAVGGVCKQTNLALWQYICTYNVCMCVCSLLFGCCLMNSWVMLSWMMCCVCPVVLYTLHVYCVAGYVTHVSPVISEVSEGWKNVVALVIVNLTTTGGSHQLTWLHCYWECCVVPLQL